MIRVSILILYIICPLVKSKEFNADIFSLEVKEKSITKTNIVFSTRERSVIKCGIMCLLTEECVSFSYKSDGECKLGKRRLNAFCTICEDDLGAIIYSKDADLVCQNGGALDVNNNCICYDGFFGTYCDQLMTNCQEGKTSSSYKGQSGIVYIKPTTAPNPFPIYCSFEEIYPRIYIQRHFGTGFDFNQTWNSYRNGFGDMLSTARNFWLGNLFIHYVTTSGFYTLVFEMGNKDGSERRQQEYEGFYVSDETTQFTFTLDNAPSSTLSGLPILGDCLSFVESGPFSTFDSDNDGVVAYGCASKHGTGWWFGYSATSCGSCNPNGVIMQSETGVRTGVDYEIFWETDMKDWAPWYSEMWLELR